MRAKGNFNDASFKRLYAVPVSINYVMNPSDADDMESPLFLYQV